MRPALLLTLLLLLAPAGASAQTTGPTGPANPVPPAATTGASSDVGQSTATVSGTVAPNGSDTTARFEYGTTTGYGLMTAAQTVTADATPSTIEAALTRLTTATTYHYRVVATNAAGVTRGADRTFRTASAPARPAIASEPARDVAVDAATLSARVDPNRQSTSAVFEYGTSTRYGAQTPAQDAGTGDTGLRVLARATGLRVNTTYHFRLRATNATGTTTGGDRTFRTGKVPLGLNAVAPSLVRYGRPLTITGTLTGTDRAGATVVLQRRNTPFTGGFATFGAPQKTDSLGVVHVVVPPFTLPSQFRLTTGALTSNVTTVGVRALVSLRVRRISGGRLRLSGAVAPGNARGAVSLQRRAANGRYVLVRRVSLRVRPGVGRFSATFRAPRTTTTYRAATRLTGGTLTDARSVSIRVRGRR